MTAQNEVTLTIHGLPVDNGNVRAEVFLEKFKSFVNSLKIADKFLNERKSFNYVIVGLKIGSAEARLRERVSVKKRIPQPSIAYVQDAIQSIYNSDKGVARFPVELIDSLEPLVRGVGKTFSHADITFDSANIIRIDDYLAKQVMRAKDRISGTEDERVKFFEGIAYGVFDGIVKEIDARGATVRGKLILTVGGKELDCVFMREDIPNLRKAFDRRARVEAVAHYDGETQLPARLDVRQIEAVETERDLSRWQGALKRPRRDLADF